MSNFKVLSYSSTSIDVEWSPIVGATEYKLSWSTGDTLFFFNSVVIVVVFSQAVESLIVRLRPGACFTGSSKPQSRYLDRNVLSHRIEGLKPKSTYSVTIRAVSGNSEGPEISLSQLTGAGQTNSKSKSHCYCYFECVGAGEQSLFPLVLTSEKL